jgi:hypothetical protein
MTEDATQTPEAAAAPPAPAPVPMNQDENPTEKPYRPLRFNAAHNKFLEG